METAFLKSKSKADLDLLLKLAAKLKIESKILSEEEIEDIGMHYAIKKGKTGQYIDKDKFIGKLLAK